MAPEKDIHTLIEISRSLPEEMKNQIDWLVVGDGPLRGELQKKRHVT